MDIIQRLQSSLNLVLSEAVYSENRYGDFKSTHEAYGVLAEEVSELLESIRANKYCEIAEEARQVSAVALRLSEMCDRELNSLRLSAFGERSGF
jgi:NTP pyrophosphatase (non-canonical NTP hydrolase)